MKINKDKRGIIGIELFEFIVTAFIIIIIIATLLFAFGIIDTELSGGNIVVGGSNISNDSTNTVGKINTAFLKYSIPLSQVDNPYSKFVI